MALFAVANNGQGDALALVLNVAGDALVDLEPLPHLGEMRFQKTGDRMLFIGALVALKPLLILGKSFDH